MTRKNSTVNPKAGTLKQQERELRINRQSGFVKSIAFALILSMTAPTLSQAMDEVSDTVKGEISRVDSSKPDNCCVLDNGQNRDKYKVVRLVIPSREMLRKSDSEANRNLVYSVRENKLNRMKSFIDASDKEINARFNAETRISTVGDLRRADQEMGIYFQSENIALNSADVMKQADRDMQDLFTFDTKGLQFSKAASIKADEEIREQFVREHTRIQLPSASDFSRADATMIVQ